MQEYFGFREAIMSDDEMSAFYGGERDENIYGCLQNEYLVLKNMEGQVCDQFKWDGSHYIKVPFKQINTRFIGKVKPRNLQQQLALVGHLPGDYKDKLLPFAMPLADHLGGVEGLEYMLGQGKVELVHLGFIRGRDIKNSIIMCSEAENMTKEHIQLLLGRVGEGSSLWMNGDYKQVDGDVFLKNSGLILAVDKLKGHPRFGFVKLLKTERSETAAMADLLD